MKIRPVGAQLFHTDGQMHMTKLTVAFRNFVKAPKNCYSYSYCEFIIQASVTDIL
jgi:hypothetical protein